MTWEAATRGLLALIGVTAAVVLVAVLAVFLRPRPDDPWRYPHDREGWGSE